MPYRPNFRSNLCSRGWRLAVCGLAILATAACTARIDTRGNLPDADLIADLEVGHITKNQVLDLIGSPSSTAPFSGESWYYISERTETLAFFEPEVKERKVLVLRFDAGGVLKEMTALDLTDGRDIQLVERTTPTAGNEITILQQIFGNIGKFNTPEGGGGTVGPQTPGGR